jgi:hypothetical protein
MLESLNRHVEDVASLNSKLILLVGPPRSGRTTLLNALAARRKTGVLSVGAALGKLLLGVSATRRHIEAGGLFRSLVAAHAVDNLVLLNNIELLFDRTLRLDPLDLLKRQAHARRIVAAWPGEISGGRLVYATMGHSEYQDYGLEGVVPFKIT